MESISNYLPVFLGVLVILISWIIIRIGLQRLSNRINNTELYKEDMLNVLEEIRDELKELNKKNSDR
ncbi:hypothetical protein [Flavobacterium sp. A45]|uniref:hypothetical protein n=1 Tax=Flavobacterium sp. A45 TaxID=1945862 RepID=UPI000984980D|nr:hypothetical protein [Flavobacterium sp. A45]OOG76704.1 hypothetical protein B0E44_03645 [Flavobacterium sp. A45]